MLFKWQPDEKKNVSPACIWKKKSLSNFPLVKSIITKCKKCKSFLYSFIHEHVQAIIITLAKWKCNKLFMMEQEYVGKINTISVSIFIHENRSCMIVTIIIRDIFNEQFRSINLNATRMWKNDRYNRIRTCFPRSCSLSL